MKRFAVIGLFALLVAGPPLRGDVVEKWRTPEGTLYFGARPPAGSTPLGTVRSLDTVDDSGAGPPDAAEAEKTRAGAAVVREKRAERSAEKRVRRELLSRAIEIGPHAVTRGNFNWIVTGVVRNTAPEDVHGVEVGAGGAWVATDPPTIPPREQATFRLEVPIYPMAEDDVLPPLEARWIGK
jgi:hypothetical protein